MLLRLVLILAIQRLLHARYFVLEQLVQSQGLADAHLVSLLRRVTLGYDAGRVRSEQFEEIESITCHLLVACPGRNSADIQRCRFSTRNIVPIIELHFYLLVWLARGERVIVWLEHYSVQKVDSANDLVDLAHVNALLSPHEHLDHLWSYFEALKFALRAQINLDAVRDWNNSSHIYRPLPYHVTISVAHHVHWSHADLVFSWKKVLFLRSRNFFDEVGEVSNHHKSSVIGLRQPLAQTALENLTKLLVLGSF